METVGSFWMWAGFAAVVAAMLAIDLFVVGGGKRHRVTMREAATWSAVWVAVALAFAVFGESLSPAQLTGGALVLAAVVTVRAPHKRQLALSST